MVSWWQENCLSMTLGIVVSYDYWAYVRSDTCVRVGVCAIACHVNAMKTGFKCSEIHSRCMGK